jgi:NAD(P)-dependent dehydrogenase (short-subunit alcohol dehydrogenase family)
VSSIRLRILYISGPNGNNFYSTSKHAVEAVAETMKLEVQEFGVEVATINPGAVPVSEELPVSA